MNIAENIILKLGGDEIVSKMVGRHRTSVLRWRQKGFIPSIFQSVLIVEGRKIGINITPDDFFKNKLIF